MLVSLTVGKVDAGVTVLLTPDKRLVCCKPPAPYSRHFPPPSPFLSITKALSVSRCRNPSQKLKKYFLGLLIPNWPLTLKKKSN